MRRWIMCVTIGVLWGVIPLAADHGPEPHRCLGLAFSTQEVATLDSMDPEVREGLTVEEQPEAYAAEVEKWLLWREARRAHLITLQQSCGVHVE